MPSPKRRRPVWILDPVTHEARRLHPPRKRRRADPKPRRPRAGYEYTNLNRAPYSNGRGYEDQAVAGLFVGAVFLLIYGAVYGCIWLVKFPLHH